MFSSCKCMCCRAVPERKTPEPSKPVAPVRVVPSAAKPQQLPPQTAALSSEDRVKLDKARDQLRDVQHAEVVRGNSSTVAEYHAELGVHYVPQGTAHTTCQAWHFLLYMSMMALLSKLARRCGGMVTAQPL